MMNMHSASGTLGLAKCLVCNSPFQSQLSKNPEHFTTMFNAFCRLLQIDLSEPMKWNFQHDHVPFCAFCYSSVEKLKGFYDQLEFLQLQITNMLHTTKVSILKAESHSRITEPAVLDRVKYFRQMVISRDRINGPFGFTDPGVKSHSDTRASTSHNNDGFSHHVGSSSNSKNITAAHLDPSLKAETQLYRDDEINLSFLDRLNAPFVFDSQLNDSLDRGKSGLTSHCEIDCRLLGDCRHKCDQCGQAFITRIDLNHHLKQVHQKSKNTSNNSSGGGGSSGKKTYGCQVCDRQLSSQQHLIWHTRTHLGERPFKCTFPLCDKTFTSSHGLRKHQGYHKFICSKCTNCFSSSAMLQRHIKVIHEAEKYETPSSGSSSSTITSAAHAFVNNFA